MCSSFLPKDKILKNLIHCLSNNTCNSAHYIRNLGFTCSLYSRLRINCKNMRELTFRTCLETEIYLICRGLCCCYVRGNFVFCLLVCLEIFFVCFTQCENQKRVFILEYFWCLILSKLNHVFRQAICKIFRARDDNGKPITLY